MLSVFSHNSIHSYLGCCRQLMLFPGAADRDSSVGSPLNSLLDQSIEFTIDLTDLVSKSVVASGIDSEMYIPQIIRQTFHGVQPYCH